MTRLTHLDEQGAARMVDVGAKEVTQRQATARGRILMKPETLSMIESGTAKKGDVLAAARIAGIMAAKRTHELIPLCHPLMISSVNVEFTLDRISEMPQMALHLDLLHLEIGNGGEQLRVPVDEPLVSVDQACAVELYEHLEHRAREPFIHGEALARPVA